MENEYNQICLGMAKDLYKDWNFQLRAKAKLDPRTIPILPTSEKKITFRWKPWSGKEYQHQEMSWIDPDASTVYAEVEDMSA